MSRTSVRGAPMFQSRLAREKWDELNEAINEAPVRIACRESDPDVWFPDNQQHHMSMEFRIAKKLCGQCPVKNLCLEFALVNEEDHGLWGGLTPAERKRLRRKR